MLHLRSASHLPSLLDALVQAPHSGAATLPIDVWSDEDSFVVQAALPGLTLDDVEVAVHDRLLTLEVTKPASLPEGVTVHLSELPAGARKRTLRIPAAVDTAAAEATLVQGILTVCLPKRADHRPHRIEIRGGPSEQN